MPARGGLALQALAQCFAAWRPRGGAAFICFFTCLKHTQYVCIWGVCLPRCRFRETLDLRILSRRWSHCLAAAPGWVLELDQSPDIQKQIQARSLACEGILRRSTNFFHAGAGHSTEAVGSNSARNPEVWFFT